MKSQGGEKKGKRRRVSKRKYVAVSKKPGCPRRGGGKKREKRGKGEQGGQ